MSSDIKLNEVKIKIADVILNLNECERWMKIVISNYISSSKKSFVNEILLNNSIINFGNKIKILEYIVKEKGIKTDKDFISALNIMASKRNALAHSDSYLEDFRLYPIVEDIDPETNTLVKGVLTNETYDKIFEVFDRKYKLVINELHQINLKI